MKTRRTKTKYSPLTPEQQATVEANMGLVWKAVTSHMAKHALPPCTSFDDLAQAGFIALCQAARHYNPEEGTRFSTYATVSIGHAIIDELNHRSSLIHVPLEPRGIREGETRLDAINRLRPRQLKTASDNYRRHNGAWTPGSSYEPIATADDLDDELDRQSHASRLHESLDAMPERARLILRARWFDGRSLQDIGVELGISKERVRQLEAKAMRDLRDHLEARMGRYCQ